MIFLIFRKVYTNQWISTLYAQHHDTPQHNTAQHCTVTEGDAAIENPCLYQELLAFWRYLGVLPQPAFRGDATHPRVENHIKHRRFFNISVFEYRKLVENRLFYKDFWNHDFLDF